MEPTLPDKAFSMGVRPAACSTGDVCMALDYLEDPAVHGITTQVCARDPSLASSFSVVFCTTTVACTVVNAAVQSSRTVRMSRRVLAWGRRP